MRETLFKIDAQGKVRVWSIWAEHHKDRSEVYIRHGINGGQLVIDRVPFISFDHRGRADSFVDSRRNRQVNRRGYSLTVPKSRPIRPMLLQRYKPGRTLPNDIHIQPKLDGIRCMGSSSWMKTRTGDVLSSMSHIQEVLMLLPDDAIFDGELYCHGKCLQELESLIKRDTPLPESRKVSLYIFDLIVEDVPYIDRFTELVSITNEFNNMYGTPSVENAIPESIPRTEPHQAKNYHPVYLLETLLISSNDLDRHYNYYLSQGYEGAVIRDPEGLYHMDTRPSCILKMKPVQKMTSKILDVVPGPKTPDMGLLKIWNPNGGFCIVSYKANHHYRKLLLKNKHQYIGKLCEVEYEDFSGDGQFLKPIVTHIYV